MPNGKLCLNNWASWGVNLHGLALSFPSWSVISGWKITFLRCCHIIYGSKVRCPRPTKYQLKNIFAYLLMDFSSPTKLDHSNCYFEVLIKSSANSSYLQVSTSSPTQSNCSSWLLLIGRTLLRIGPCLGTTHLRDVTSFPENLNWLNFVNGMLSICQLGWP